MVTSGNPNPNWWYVNSSIQDAAAAFVYVSGDDPIGAMRTHLDPFNPIMECVHSYIEKQFPPL